MVTVTIYWQHGNSFSMFEPRKQTPLALNETIRRNLQAVVRINIWLAIRSGNVYDQSFVQCGLLTSAKFTIPV